MYRLQLMTIVTWVLCHPSVYPLKTVTLIADLEPFRCLSILNICMFETAFLYFTESIFPFHWVVQGDTKINMERVLGRDAENTAATSKWDTHISGNLGTGNYPKLRILKSLCQLLFLFFSWPSALTLASFAPNNGWERDFIWWKEHFSNLLNGIPSPKSTWSKWGRGAWCQLGTKKEIVQAIKKTNARAVKPRVQITYHQKL